MKPREYAIVLGALAAAFLLRVVGQLIVWAFDADFLPPMDQWYSGLIPYPILLTTQIGILVLQAFISRDLWRGHGRYASRWPAAGTFIRWFSYIYFTVMAARYVIVMIHHPERRWFVGAIPIFFHWVLAAYLFVWSRFHLDTTGSSVRRPGD